MTATLGQVSAPAAFDQIPVVDLGPLSGSRAEREAIAEELCRICHEVGFLLVVNHGVSGELSSGIFDMMHRFFALSGEQKKLIDKRRSRHFRGWEPEGAEYTNNRPDIREQIDWWTEWPAYPKDVEPYYLRLLGPNQWLPEELLPGPNLSQNSIFDKELLCKVI